MEATQKMGAQRASPSKRKSTPRKPITSAEGAQPPKQRRKVSGVSVSLAASKPREKAASARPTLMAEVAEHLEKIADVEQVENLEVAEPHRSHTTQVSSITYDIGYRMNHHLSTIDICASKVPCSIVLKDGPATTNDISRRSGDTKCISDVDSELCSGLPVSFQAAKTGVPCSVLSSSPTTFTSSRLTTMPVVACNDLAEIPSNAKTCGETIRQTAGQNPKNTPSKLKLQLFPIDTVTLHTLEQDGLNPHLELTFKHGKAITSILQHLVSKWGSSSIANGELRLFPFDTNRVDAACESWSSKDVALTAADVHKFLGSPEIFRLRYGWLSSRVLQTSCAVLPEEHPRLSAIFDSNASLNLDLGKAFMPVTALQLGFPTVKDPVGSNKLYLCDVAGVQKNRPSCFEQARSRAVAHLANSAASTLNLEALVQGGHYHASSMLHLETKENIPNIGMHANKLLARKSYGCTKTCTPPAVLSFEQGSDVNGIGRESIDAQLASCSWLYKGSNDGFAQFLWNDEDPLQSNRGTNLPSEMHWVDNNSNISIGELLNQVSHATDCSIIQFDPLGVTEKSDLSPSLESFKAMQAQHLTTEPLVLSAAQTQQQSGILGAEDTRDSFSFHRVCFSGSVVDASSLDKSSGHPMPLGGKNLPYSSIPWVKPAVLTEDAISEKQVQEISNPITKDADGRSSSHTMPLEFYLADSLGALDLGMDNQSGAHQGQDIFLNGDSSVGFSRLIGVLGEGDLENLLGVQNQNENVSMYR